MSFNFWDLIYSHGAFALEFSGVAMKDLRITSNELRERYSTSDLLFDKVPLLDVIGSLLAVRGTSK